MFPIRSENIDKRHKSLVLLALALLFVACCGVHFYSRYKMKQALSLLTEATAIKVGDNEETVLPLIARYGGTKIYPESAQADSAGDSYEIKLSPFQVFSNGHGAMAYVMAYVPNYLRGFLGLRNWLVTVGVRVQKGRVKSVNGDVFVEGGSRWLGNSWHKSPGVDEASSAYSVEMSSLNIARNGGSGLDESFPPAATHEQERISYEFNRSCLTGFIPCSTLCDFKPNLFRYLKEHPEVRVNFEIDRCRLPQSSNPK
jgi:hypothetical protein